MKIWTYQKMIVFISMKRTFHRQTLIWSSASAWLEDPFVAVQNLPRESFLIQCIWNLFLGLPKPLSIFLTSDPVVLLIISSCSFYYTQSAILSSIAIPPYCLHPYFSNGSDNLSLSLTLQNSNSSPLSLKALKNLELNKNAKPCMRQSR